MPTRPPGPRSLTPFGLFREFKKNPAEFLVRVARDYGDVAYFRLGAQAIYLLNHPDLIRDVLVTHQSQFKKSRMLERAKILLGEGLLTSEGHMHLRQRRLIQPAFHRDRIARYGESMIRHAAAFEPGAGAFDMSAAMMKLTLAIVAETLFGASVSGEAAEVGRSLSDVFELFDLLLMPFSRILQELPFPAVRKFHAARKRMDAIVYGMIEARRRTGEHGDDLLGMLLAAEDEDNTTRHMSDRQVRDEALTLFLAGHETTANALTWVWYLLSLNPQAEAELHRELNAVLGTREPSLDDLGRLKYTEGVFLEALRLYPPAWTLGRRALSTYEVGGYRIPAGSIVIMSPYVSHRDPRWFPDPLRFAPERWSEPDTRPKFAYFPFGGGARVCIGERFAQTEGVLLLASIARRWRFSLQAAQSVDIHPRITLRPKSAVMMTATTR